MGALATFLQQEFKRKCPLGWSCLPEKHLLPATLEQLLGYAARADVLLEKQDGTRRLWVEFEVSRADPVANHAKFATSHIFKPQAPTDSFVSMVSPHVTRGRRNLAANTIVLMRHIGMRAFQTILFPHLTPQEIQRLNHLSVAELGGEGVSVEQEIERAIAISEPAIKMIDYDIHLVGDLLDVFLNLRQWNDDLAKEEGARLWGKRTVIYFVYEAESGLFAPSKFCAYSAVPTNLHLTAPGETNQSLATMTVAKYVTISDGSHLLDGNRAQTHLTAALGMMPLAAGKATSVDEHFSSWRSLHNDHVNVHPNGPVFLQAPEWFK